MRNFRKKAKYPKENLDCYYRLQYQQYRHSRCFRLVSNTDDHARNHAAFRDGKHLTLTPAYDICLQNRTGREASQAMNIIGEKNLSKLELCLQNAASFSLSKQAARMIIKHQIRVITNRWKSVCDEVKLSESDRRRLWGQQILNPFSVSGFEHLIV